MKDLQLKPWLRGLLMGLLIGGIVAFALSQVFNWDFWSVVVIPIGAAFFGLTLPLFGRRKEVWGFLLIIFMSAIIYDKWHTYYIKEEKPLTYATKNFGLEYADNMSATEENVHPVKSQEALIKEILFMVDKLGAQNLGDTATINGLVAQLDIKTGSYLVITEAINRAKEAILGVKINSNQVGQQNNQSLNPSNQSSQPEKQPDIPMFYDFILQPGQTRDVALEDAEGNQYKYDVTFSNDVFIIANGERKVYYQGVAYGEELPWDKTIIFESLPDKTASVTIELFLL